MKLITARQATQLRSLLQPASQRRWRSYDRSEVTKEALLAKVNSSFGDDSYAEPLSVNADSKTISTVNGDLPISPLFDPAWMSARRRQTKRPPASSGRFRKKLLNNPYAQALASPMRTCSATHTKLPRYFLQDFEMVRHPETGKPWFAPGPLSFDSSTAPSNNPDAITQPESESTETTTRRHSRARAPITVYAACRKSLLDLMNSSHRKFLGSMIGPRGGMAMTTETREAILRKDMGDVLLSMLRRQASDLLVERANQSPDSVARSFQRCDNWEDIDKVTARGCVLWIPGSKDNATNPSYATYDIEGARYDGKVAVHDLVYLLGDAQVSWLRKAAPDTFGDGGIVVLRLHHSRRMAKIHMLLWRLQGYLAPPTNETKVA